MKKEHRDRILSASEPQNRFGLLLWRWFYQKSVWACSLKPIGVHCSLLQQQTSRLLKAVQLYQPERLYHLKAVNLWLDPSPHKGRARSCTSRFSSDPVPLPKPLVLSFSDWQEENGRASPEPEGNSYWFRVLRRCWWPQVQRLVAECIEREKIKMKLSTKEGDKWDILNLHNLSKQKLILPTTAENTRV